jgi:uncharacterized protein YcbK (DUF882 family)
MSVLSVFSFSVAAQSAPRPFFLMGDGTIWIKNDHTGKAAKVHLVDAQGKFNEQAYTEIDAVFGFPTMQMGEHISQRLICMLDYFSDFFAQGKQIHLISGYRSPEYNQGLRDQGKLAAKTSVHQDGLALDFYLSGVDSKKMWETIRHKDCCGVGHYGGKSIHLDAARPRFWEAATSGVHTNASENNKLIYFSTEFDRYQPGDRVRVFLAGISDYGFGVEPQLSLVRDVEGKQNETDLPLENETASCQAVATHKDARFLYVTLPADLRQGRYRVRINFCDRPFDEMPEMKVSNEIEVIRGEG